MGIIILVLLGIGGIQALLSLRKNTYMGLFIPALNVLIATIFGMMTTDYVVGYFVFVVVLLPLVLWLGIYKLCRHKTNSKAEKDMKKLRIKDL